MAILRTKFRRMPRPRKSTYGNEKPPYSYVALCAMAIQNSATGMLTLNEIYRFITNSFPFYKTNSSKWRNSLRHNLSYNDCFVKIVCTTSNGSKKSYWSLHPNCGNMFKDGSLLRRKKRFVTGKQSAVNRECSWETSKEHEYMKGLDIHVGEFQKPCVRLSKECKAGIENHIGKEKTDFSIDNILRSPIRRKDYIKSTCSDFTQSKTAGLSKHVKQPIECSYDSHKLYPDRFSHRGCQKSIPVTDWVYYDTCRRSHHDFAVTNNPLPCMSQRRKSLLCSCCSHG